MAGNWIGWVERNLLLLIQSPKLFDILSLSTNYDLRYVDREPLILQINREALIWPEVALLGARKEEPYDEKEVAIDEESAYTQ